MTQLDLPPISFARYLELLKRRRWQVIPMSLLGLLVGALVAFFIPRYYVAQTQLTYVPLPFDTTSMTEADPLYQKVRGAEYSIDAAIPAALEQLDWIGTNEADPARQATIDAVRDRTEVLAFQAQKDRTDYFVNISYQDTDRERAEDFANELRETWVGSMMEEFEALASAMMRSAMLEVASLREARNARHLELTNFRKDHGLERSDQLDGQIEAERSLTVERREAERLLRETQIELANTEIALKDLEAQINDGVIKPKIPKELAVGSDPQVPPEVRRLIAEVARWELAGGAWLPGTYMHESSRRRAETAKRKLVELLPAGVVDGNTVREEDNPAYAEAMKQIGELRLRRQQLQSELAVHEENIERLRVDSREKPLLWRQVERLELELQLAQERVVAAQERVDRMTAQYNRVQTINPFRVVSFATVPPVPTEPDITLVALLGSLLGLGVAIGIILLLDVLRTTFKTPEDVGYALRIPVLGVMSYLETEEEHARIVRGRQIITAVVALFLILVLSVVTIYYVAPTRLPVWVFQGLDAVLGAETGG